MTNKRKHATEKDKAKDGEDFRERNNGIETSPKGKEEDVASNHCEQQTTHTKRRITIPLDGNEEEERATTGNSNCNHRDDSHKRAILTLPRAGPIKYMRQGRPIPKVIAQQPDAILIGVKDQYGSEEVLFVKKTMPMQWLFQRYASKKGVVDTSSLRFLIHGKEVGQGDTANSLGFVNVGHMDVVSLGV
eukprot:CAMPEP_0196208328 /NCGR_PEP_ID=MMETSP0912-20130531/8976_1 /TAXON_ID=49265 /ORGANISM="Thalassiosira rotula, Strain GSO102" /LENGTH=188 /DNA_ID=CAMNT_0041483109 /DNA_START=82 /DNA_END=648 /DNA_ORIENTATION=-